jgi:hypothetical protein
MIPDGRCVVRVSIILTAIFIMSAVVAALVAPQRANRGFADAASVLAFIGLAAVAIERSIEGMYTLLSGRLGQWWPLKLIRAEFDTFESHTDDLLGPILRTTLAGLGTAHDAAAAGSADALALQHKIDEITTTGLRLKTQFDDVRQKLVPGSDRLARVGEVNAQITDTLRQAQALATAATHDAGEALRVASDGAERAALIISSIQDNPARRLASLALGASLGMLVAGMAGLNLFAAALVGDSSDVTALPPLVAGGFGVVLTGIVIGLGSAPTHEVVRSLQAYKETRVGGDLLMSAGAPVAGTISEVVTEASFDGGAGMTGSRTVTRTLDAGVRVHRVRRTG